MNAGFAENAASLHKQEQCGTSGGVRESHIDGVSCANLQRCGRRLGALTWKQENPMKKSFGIVMLASVIAAQAFTQAANAAPNDGRDGIVQKTACTYQGYPCDDWNRQDGW